MGPIGGYQESGRRRCERGHFARSAVHSDVLHVPRFKSTHMVRPCTQPHTVRVITNALNVVEKPRLCYNSTGFISCMLFRPLDS
jgi:hypothetical protein